jgi:hypothetical protein
MEAIKVEISEEKLRIGLEKAIDELFKSSYSNPINDILKKCVNEKEGEIKKIIDAIIVQAIGSPDFKTKMSDLVIQRMVESALKK